MVLKGELFCRPEILRRFFGGQPLVLGGMVGFHRNFFGEGGYGLSYFFFGGIGEYLSRSIQKCFFLRF